MRDIFIRFNELPERSGKFWTVFIGTALLLLGIALYLTVYVDHPFLIATKSRALYVDEGFYSDAAQNFVKFGSWSVPHDMKHWVGAPFLAVLQTPVFSIFGAQLVVARMISVCASIVSCLALYFIARTFMTPAISALVTLSTAVTFNFIAFARAAVVDPVATCLVLLAILAFGRFRNRNIAIPVSMLFAMLALFSKIYYSFVFVSLFVVWLFELIIIPATRKQRLAKGRIAIFTASVGAAISIYAFYSVYFAEDLEIYLKANKGQLPAFDIGFYFENVLHSLNFLFFNTKQDVFLYVIAFAGIIAVVLLLVPPSIENIKSRLSSVSKAEWATWLALVLGLIMVGVSRQHKEHYHFFSIPLISLVAAGALFRLVPERYRNASIIGVLALHLSLQVPLYVKWANRSPRAGIVIASNAIVAIIEREHSSGMIPVIGEYASELGLYSNRIHSLDVKWATQEDLCKRIDYWRPVYHVNIIWPKSGSRGEKLHIKNCSIVKSAKEIKRYVIFGPRDDLIVLSQIEYRNNRP